MHCAYVLTCSHAEWMVGTREHTHIYWIAHWMINDLLSLILSLFLVLHYIYKCKREPYKCIWSVFLLLFFLRFFMCVLFLVYFFFLRGLFFDHSFFVVVAFRTYKYWRTKCSHTFVFVLEWVNCWVNEARTKMRQIFVLFCSKFIKYV